MNSLYRVENCNNNKSESKYHKIGYRLYTLLREISRDLSALFLNDSEIVGIRKLRQRRVDSLKMNIRKRCGDICRIISALRDEPESIENLQKIFSSMVELIIKGQGTPPNRINSEIIGHHVHNLLKVDRSADEFNLISKMLVLIGNDEEALERYVILLLKDRQSKKQLWSQV